MSITSPQLNVINTAKAWKRGVDRHLGRRPGKPTREELEAYFPDRSMRLLYLSVARLLELERSDKERREPLAPVVYITSAKKRTKK